MSCRHLQQRHWATRVHEVSAWHVRRPCCSSCTPCTRITCIVLVTTCARFANTTGSTACRRCEAGTFNNAFGQPECFQCEPGNYAGGTGHTSCTPCKPGTYGPSPGLVECPPCPRGAAAGLSGQTVCQECARGMFANTTGSIECMTCPVKTQAAPGSSVCAPCARGQVQPSGTRDCVTCLSGSYSWIPGEHITPECHRCPAAGYCAGGDAMVARRGWWRSSNESTLFHECLRPDSCNGWSADPVALSSPERRLSDDSSPREACEEGYQGPLCLDCEPNWGRSGTHKCGPCRADTVVLLAVLAVLALLLVVFMVWKQIRASDKLQVGTLGVVSGSVSCAYATTHTDATHWADVCVAGGNP